jgi:hypothetical protein
MRQTARISSATTATIARPGANRIATTAISDFRRYDGIEPRDPFR